MSTINISPKAQEQHWDMIISQDTNSLCLTVRACITIVTCLYSLSVVLSLASATTRILNSSRAFSIKLANNMEIGRLITDQDHRCADEFVDSLQTSILQLNTKKVIYRVRVSSYDYSVWIAGSFLSFIYETYSDFVLLHGISN